MCLVIQKLLVLFLQRFYYFSLGKPFQITQKNSSNYWFLHDHTLSALNNVNYISIMPARESWFVNKDALTFKTFSQLRRSRVTFLWMVNKGVEVKHLRVLKFLYNWNFNSLYLFRRVNQYKNLWGYFKDALTFTADQSCKHSHE